MSVLTFIYSQYSITDLLRLVLSTVGAATILVLVSAFVGILSYIDALPTSGGAFGHLTDIRKLGFDLMRWLFFTVAFIVFSLYVVTGGPLLSGWFGIVIALWFIDQIANKLVKLEWTYDDFVLRDFSDLRYKNAVIEERRAKGLMKGSEKMMKMFGLWSLPKGKNYLRSNTNILFLSILGTFLLVLWVIATDVEIPIIGWALIIYEVVVFLLNTALRDGVFRRYSKSPYQIIKRTDGKNERGYIISAAPDHFLFITKEERKTVFNNSVLEMIDNQLNPDVLDRMKKKSE